jgi:pimeloyl-ACP methyl ester carboxylesterase
MTTAVFVHGAWHDAWCWEFVRARLDEAGVASVAVDLPMTTLDADAAVVRHALRSLDDDAVVIGHSWGGSPVTLGASGEGNVRHLIYLCAFMIEAGIPVTDPATRRGTSRAELLETVDDKMLINPDLVADAFYNDVSPELAAKAIARLRPFYLTGFLPLDTSAKAAWKTVPTTYVVCTQDKAIHPDDQRDMAKNASEIVEIDTSHSPFLSRPDLVADLVIERVRRYEA